MTNPTLTFRSIHTIVFDFDGVFTDNSVYVNDSGEESVRCSRSDSYGISLLNQAKVNQYPFLDFFVLSTEKNNVVSTRCLKMDIKCFSGIDDKLGFLELWLKKNRSTYSDSSQGVAYFGNDLNDLGAMLIAGTSFAPADAHLMIKGIATNNLESLGGQGFVREGVELILGIEAMNLEEVNEFISHRRNRD